MNLSHQQTQVRADVVGDMREMARKGASVPQLVRAVQTRVGYSEHASLPILWYFMTAFCLPLPIVLPLREWFAKGNDDEINALLLPEIARTEAEWNQGTSNPPSLNGVNG